MLKRFDRMFAHFSFRFCAVLLLASGLVLGQQRRPVLKGGVQKQVESDEDVCQVLREALDLYGRTAKSPNVLLPEDWRESRDKVEAVFDPASQSPEVHRKVMDCHCPVTTARDRIERLKRMQTERLNPRARDPRSLQAFDRAIQDEKVHIQTELKQAEECYQKLCKGIPTTISPPLRGSIGKKGNESPRRGQVDKDDSDGDTPRKGSASREDEESQRTSSVCVCKDPPEPPLPNRPAPEICNLRELASLVFRRYNTGYPIGIVRVLDEARPTYLLLLSGTEHIRNDEIAYDQATGLIQDFQEAYNYSSHYRKAILDALYQAHIPEGSIIIVAGHSLGGMVGQNLVADKEFKMRKIDDSSLKYGLGLRAEMVITYGSPYTLTREPQVHYVHVEARGDPIPGIVNARLAGTVVRINGRGPLDPVGSHSIYPQSEELEHYYLTGSPVVTWHGPTPPTPPLNDCLYLDMASLHNYRAPKVVPVSNKKKSEEIGEWGMNVMAKSLGYRAIVPPAAASGYVQGYDGVYWDPINCAIVIGEAKGGYNRKSKDEILREGYGFKQGTIDWARAAAMRIVRSSITNDLEVRWAEMILCIIGVYKDYKKNENLVSLKLDFCKEVHDCKASVRIELFHTEIDEFGNPGRTMHDVLARYGPSYDSKTLPSRQPRNRR